MKNWQSAFSIALLALAFCLASSCNQQEGGAAVETEGEGSLTLEEIPEAVLDALNTRFPKAEIQKWTRETEGDLVIYDIEFEQEGRKFEADIIEEGRIHNWEKEIEIKDLPQPVKISARVAYPASTVKEIMEITAVVEGKEVLEGYELVLETADAGEMEITVGQDGTILEDSGKKEQERKEE